MKLLTAIILAACCGSAFAQTDIKTEPLEKLTGAPDSTKAILSVVYPPAAYQCKHFDLYIQRVKPAGSKDPDNAFRGYFWIAPPDAKTTNPSQGIVNSKDGKDITAICIQNAGK